MGLITDPITYNVKVRGRQHLGVDRNLDCAALAGLLNGPTVQERVRKGDMLGYYGHWPRMKFGMDPAEGGIVDGVAVSVPPAIRMVELSADDEGNITHRIEFLDSAEGQIAQKLYESKVGGFSTAIDVRPGTMPQVPVGFYGADFVTAFGGPNYDGNRGYRGIMDSAVDGGEAERAEALAMLDAIATENFDAAKHLNTLLDAVLAQQKDALTTLEAQGKEVDRLRAENDLLIGRLAAGKGGEQVLDSTGQGYVAPVTPGRDAEQKFGRFKDMPLAALAELPEKKGSSKSPDLEAAERHFKVSL